MRPRVRASAILGSLDCDLIYSNPKNVTAVMKADDKEGGEKRKSFPLSVRGDDFLIISQARLSRGDGESDVVCVCVVVVAFDAVPVGFVAPKKLFTRSGTSK